MCSSKSGVGRGRLSYLYSLATAFTLSGTEIGVHSSIPRKMENVDPDSSWTAMPTSAKQLHSLIMVFTVAQKMELAANLLFSAPSCLLQFFWLPWVSYVLFLSFLLVVLCILLCGILRFRQFSNRGCLSSSYQRSADFLKRLTGNGIHVTTVCVLLVYPDILVALSMYSSAVGTSWLPYRTIIYRSKTRTNT